MRSRKKCCACRLGEELLRIIAVKFNSYSPPGPSRLLALCAMVRGLGKGHCDRHPLVTQVRAEASLSPAAGTSLCRRLHRRVQPWLANRGHRLKTQFFSVVWGTTEICSTIRSGTRTEGTGGLGHHRNLLLDSFWDTLRWHGLNSSPNFLHDLENQ